MKKYVNGEYVEMTEGEIKHIEEILKDEPVTEPTIEEQILALQNALITSKISGGGITTITDSSDNQIKNLKVFGKSEQVQTTGAQLFNAREALKSQIEKGIVSFDNDLLILNGMFNSSNRQFSITLQPGTYTLSGDDNGVWHILAPTDCIFRRKLVVEVETTYACYIASGTYNNHVTAPMINIGETAKPYEPYTGVKPSPSPEYPQEIKGAGKLNEDIMQYEIAITKHGKNLLNAEQLTVGSYNVGNGQGIYTPKAVITPYIAVEHNVISISAPTSLVAYSVGQYDSNKNFLSPVIPKSGTCTLNAKTKLIRIVFRNNLKKDFDNTLLNEVRKYKIQVEYSVTPTKFEPYNDGIINKFQMSKELQGLPVNTDANIVYNVYTDDSGQNWICDEIDLARGKYVQRVKEKYIVPKPMSNHTEAKWILTYRCTDTDLNLVTGGANAYKSFLCERFAFRNITKESEYNYSFVGAYRHADYVELRWYILKTDCETIEEAIEYASSNILYITATPIETDLPPETIEAFKTLHSNYPTTVISNDENAGMEVSYVADTKHYIDKKFEELNQAIVNTQIALL